MNELFKGFLGEYEGGKSPTWCSKMTLNYQSELSPYKNVRIKNPPKIISLL